jgi:hypothetical protein
LISILSLFPRVENPGLKLANASGVPTLCAKLSGFGDEAFAPERDGPSIVLRRGRFVIYINTIADVESDPDAQILSRVEREARQKAEVHRIGREFAKQLSSIDLQ